MEGVREEKSANRKNPLDEELIKTKGLLKATPMRKESSLLKPDNSAESAIKATAELPKRKDSFKSLGVSIRCCSKGETSSSGDGATSTKNETSPGSSNGKGDNLDPDSTEGNCSSESDDMEPVCRLNSVSSIISAELAKKENTSVPSIDTDQTEGVSKHLSPQSHPTLRLTNNICEVLQKTDSNKLPSKDSDDNLSTSNGGLSISHSKIDCIQGTKKVKILSHSAKECGQHASKDGVSKSNGDSGDVSSDIFVSPAIHKGLVVSISDDANTEDCSELTECSVEATVVLSVKS